MKLYTNNGFACDHIGELRSMALKHAKEGHMHSSTLRRLRAAEAMARKSWPLWNAMEAIERGDSMRWAPPVALYKLINRQAFAVKQQCATIECSPQEYKELKRYAAHWEQHQIKEMKQRHSSELCQ
jgi:hypothetical protein